MASLACTLAGLHLDCAIFNASGPRTGAAEALARISSSAAGAVLAKSATVNGQDGNDKPRTWQGDAASLNSEGLPNKGIDYYLDAATVAAAKGETGKPYFVSLSGKNLAENLEMLRRADRIEGISAIELNLACPNVIGHPIIAYDFDQMEAVLDEVEKIVLSVPLGIKMPPYFDFQHFKKAADLLNTYDCVSYVATINTLGNALAIDVDAEQPLIRPKGGFGGMSGPAVKHTALANVKKLRELLRDDIDVVGVGGVRSGRDAFEMFLCGATAVQVGTCHWIEGPQCFDRIASELRALMREKGYATLDDFRGKLKPWSKERASESRAQRRAAKQAEAASASASGAQRAYLAIIALLVAAVAFLLAKDQGLLL